MLLLLFSPAPAATHTATVARVAVRTALYGFLTGFMATNPTELYSTFSARPSALGIATPGGFTGNLNEPRIVHTSGTRQRNWQTEIVLFDTFSPSNEDQADRLDTLVDAFLDYLTANPTFAVGTGQGLQQPTSVTDGELSITGGQDTVHYRAIAIGIQITVMEGRN